MCCPVSCPNRRPTPSLCRSGACQIINSARYIPGTGRMYVEWCETLWSRMGGLGNITRYHTFLGRRAKHEHAAALHNQQLRISLKTFAPWR